MGWILAGVFFLTTILAVIVAVRTHRLRHRQRRNIRDEREKDESAGDKFVGDGGGDAQNLTLISQ